MKNIVHDHWPQTNKKGIGLQRIAIVGYSHHHSDKHVDSRGLSVGVMRKVVNGEAKIAFFSKIQRYFGCDGDADFWNRVTFFNYLPNCIGESEDKYKVGSDDQLKAARGRAMEILSTEKPQKVLFFTKKGWNDFRVNVASDVACSPLIPGSTEPSWVALRVNGRRVLVCGLRHPQYAKGLELAAQVQAFLSMS